MTGYFFENIGKGSNLEGAVVRNGYMMRAPLVGGNPDRVGYLDTA